jgi:putative aldouronate transport system substrate-binding protein
MGFKVTKCLASILIPLTLIGMLSACNGKKNVDQQSISQQTQQQSSQQSTTEPKPILDEVTLNFMFFHLVPNKYEDIIAEFEKRTKDTLNTKLKWEFVPFEDYPNKVKLKLSAGEQMDSIFDAPWWMMNDMISQGNYIALDEYFNNDKYPGLKEAFPQDYLDYNKFNGKIYGIPFTQAYGQAPDQGFMVNEALMQKYGITEINTIEEMAAFCDKVLANDKDIIPIVAQGAYNLTASLFNRENIILANKDNIFDLTVGDFLTAKILISNDQKSIVSVNFEGDPADLYKDYPEPFKTDITTNKQYNLIREWYKKGYFEKDALNQKDPSGLIQGNKAAATPSKSGGLKGWKYVLLCTESYIATPQSMANTFKAGNFQCIPATSKNVARTMMFYDWLFSDRENHDLFEYGIKGVDWEPVSEKEYKLLPEGIDPTKAYNMYWFQLTGIPKWTRFPEGTDPLRAKVNEVNQNKDVFYLSPLTGFTFNSESVKTEIAKVAPILTTNLQPVRWGMVDNFDQTLKKANDKAKGMGLEKIRDELKKQLQAFLDTKK